MPDDVHTDDEIDATNEAETSEIVHDDIVKRLLDYQRQLREGLDARGAATATATTATITASTATDELVDLTAAEESAASRNESADERGAAGAVEHPGAGDDAGDAVSGGAGFGTREDAVAGDVSADVIVLHPVTPGDETVPEVTSEDAVTAAEGEASTGAWPGTEGSASAALAGASANEPDDGTDEAADRVLELERSLETLAARFDSLRSSFQDMAIAADVRLAEIEELITAVRRSR